MFTDLRGFTTFSESAAAAEVIESLNVYLSEMSEAILNNGGTLVAYMGDGIMAVFGAPIEQPDHADRALAAGREMLTTRLPHFNALMEERSSARLQDGRRTEHGPVHVRQRRLRATARVHGDRRHDEHGVTPGGDDEGPAARPLHVRHDEGSALTTGRARHRLRRRVRGSRAAGAGEDLVDRGRRRRGVRSADYRPRARARYDWPALTSLRSCAGGSPGR